MGSNSHMATMAMLGNRNDLEIIACAVSAQVLAKVVAGEVDGAVLPIENSLHGSVAEHYDLLLEHPIRIDRESLLRIRHNLIAAPGVTLEGAACDLAPGGAVAVQAVFRSDERRAGDAVLRYCREREACDDGESARYGGSGSGTGGG